MKGFILVLVVVFALVLQDFYAHAEEDEELLERFRSYPRRGEKRRGGVGQPGKRNKPNRGQGKKGKEIDKGRRSQTEKATDTDTENQRQRQSSDTI